MSPDTPVASVVPRRHALWLWILPVAILILIAPTLWHQLHGNAPRLTLHFADGRGLKVEDNIRYRGIAVGEVKSITLDRQATDVRVEVQLQEDAASLAQQGSLFWIVHPEISWGSVVGLDTLAGSRYIDVLPGHGKEQREFTGIESTPIDALSPPGCLEIIIQADTRGGIHTGSPVTYRQVTIGRVISSTLASDGGNVDLRCTIDPSFARLVREKTVFWQDSGVAIHASLGSGLHVAIDSLETLVSGGIGMSTPPQGGEEVTNGHSFALQGEVQEAWKRWQPAVPVGQSALLGEIPHPLSTVLDCRYHELLGTDHRSRRGWTLALPDALIGPADLLDPASEPHGAACTLQIAGALIPLTGGTQWSQHGVAMLSLASGMLPSVPRWTTTRMRCPAAPEDCLILSDPGLEPIALDQPRLHADANGWAIEGSIPVPPSWHGSAVVARSDGDLIGFLILKDDKDDAKPHIALLPSSTSWGSPRPSAPPAPSVPGQSGAPTGTPTGPEDSPQVPVPQGIPGLQPASRLHQG